MDLVKEIDGYSIKSDGEMYFLYKESRQIKTPAGNSIVTTYFDVADKLLSDFSEYGYDLYRGSSLIGWHCTLIDQFINMSAEEVFSILDDSFLSFADWTFDKHGSNPEEEQYWANTFGNYEDRSEAIRNWLKKCTHMQMTAACCVGNTFGSINVAYCLAEIFESGEDCDYFASILRSVRRYMSYSEMITVIRNFNIYYGIHFRENGPIIIQPKIEEKELEVETNKRIIEHVELITNYLFNNPDTVINHEFLVMIDSMEKKQGITGLTTDELKTVSDTLEKSYFRKTNGEIVCLGDSCAKRPCPEDCPINISSNGSKALKKGDSNEALTKAYKALAFAPNAHGFYCNLGALFAINGELKKALVYYTVSHNLSPHEWNPVFYLAMVNKDLGNYAEALKWCDVLESMAFSPEISEIKSICQAKLKK